MSRELSPTKRYYESFQVYGGEEGWYYRTKADVNVIGGSRILKRTSPPAKEKTNKKRKLSTEGNPHDDNMNFFDLYIKVSNSEEQNECARREFLKSYYHFGEA